MSRAVYEDDVIKLLNRGWKSGRYPLGCDVRALPSAQPEQDILSWLLAYHAKSFDLHGRYMPHEVIGWLVHDFANTYMAERHEE